MRRRTGVVAGIALLGLLAGCSSPGPPAASSPGASRSGTSSSTTSSGPRAWVPSDRYLDPAALVGKVASLVPKPTIVTSATGTSGADPVCPVADVPCLRPAYAVDLAVADGDLTSVLLVTQSVAAVPDVTADPCTPPGLAHPSAGYHCVVTAPWTKRDGLWLAGTRLGASEFDCRQETVVRRGRTAVVASERLAQDLCVSPTSSADLPAAAPLDAVAVEALALATPLVRSLAFFTDVAIDPTSPSPPPSSTVPVTGFWVPTDGVVTEDQFVDVVTRSLPSGVLGELVDPSDVAPVPCSLYACGYLNGSGPPPDRTLHAAFNVSRDNQAGLLVLGEDGRRSSSTVLNTCVGYRGCSQLVPWTRHGSAWTAVFENVHADTGMIDRTAYVVRGSSAFGASSQTQALRDDDTLATLVGAQPLLTADELLALVTSLPLGAQEQILIRHGSTLDRRPGPAPGPRQSQWPGPLS